MAGYRREFDERLEVVEAEVIGLFAMIADDLPRATAALLGAGRPCRRDRDRGER
jgi:hypothetical protein